MSLVNQIVPAKSKRSVHNIVQKIGYPTKSPDIRDSSALQEYYESVDISNATFFENALSMTRFETKREWSALGKPTDRDEWGLTADTVNVCDIMTFDGRSD